MRHKKRLPPNNTNSQVYCTDVLVYFHYHQVQSAVSFLSLAKAKPERHTSKPSLFI